jgi:hypothetical protein
MILEDIHAENGAQPRFEMLLMGVFAGLRRCLRRWACMA